jgi:hypothetical protein
MRLVRDRGNGVRRMSAYSLTASAPPTFAASTMRTGSI